MVEMRVEAKLFWLIAIVALVPVTHYLLQKLRERSVLIEEEREGADGDFQLLGLCGDLTT